MVSRERGMKMIKVEPCRSCGRNLLVETQAGLVIRTEYTPLDAQGALASLVGGHTLREVDVHADGRPRTFRPAGPAVLGGLNHPDPAHRPKVVADHRCTKRGTEAVANAVQQAQQSKAVPTDPKAPAGATTASPERQTGPFRATPAGPRRSSRTRTHPCHGCGQPVNIDGAEAFVAELGAAVVFAAHASC